jgi:hypothetical protein
MPISSNAKQDRSAGIEAALKPGIPWHVTAVQPAPDYTFTVEFADGVSGTVRMAGMIHADDAGVFAALRDVAMFMQAFVSEHGAVTWPGELDLAPDAMYDEIRAKGEWVL